MNRIVTPQTPYASAKASATRGKGLKERTMSISDKVSMFYGAKPHIFEKAKSLRRDMTDSELKLWEELKAKKILELRFRAQHPINIFIADFYCHPVKLVIEVDGGIHKSRDQKEYDIGRTEELNALGIEVIRFTNEDIEKDINYVIKEIERVCFKRQSELLQSPLQGI